MPDAPTPAWFTDALAVPVATGEVDVDGVAIRYRAWGEPGHQGLVLVHGGGAHSRWWDHVAPLLVQGRRRVVALDLSGHGDSGRAGAYRLDRWADEVLAVARHSGAGPGSCRSGEAPVVVGHSMGGFVALTAALRHGHELTGVMAIDSPVRDRSPEELAARQQRAFGPMRVYPDRQTALAHFRTVPEQEGDLPYVVEHVAGHSVTEVAGGWSWKFDRGIFAGLGLTPGELGRVDCRVALFRAEHGLVPADMGEMIVDLMGRVAPLVEIPGAAHHVMVDQPLALVTGLRTMLADWEHSVPQAPPASPAASSASSGGRRPS
ncbi:alpha/beta fold hydrolase [Pseudonocardia sp. KRD291]|uniref:alpha/beta fold hydrolase n=1 Tax=Pseudonocardia sp. KRD291 TaxID=2792007 RepID=UPI001C49FABE|nr:alpha/beta hydrolase [Pseudonocardia sp. KRD291]MBW0104978.1 alpha/beta hydrolase [Pseudonocardia sp. KRD291]